jgi:H+/gluconate symporter-like permease
VFVAAIVASFIIALTGNYNIYNALKVEYMTGFVGFIKSNFLVFVVGALLGKVYEITNGAKSIANLIVTKAGKKFALISIPLAMGIMTYGGIQGYVLCFAVFPIALEVYRAADIPRRFIPAAIVMGACTWSSFGPFNPQVPNVAAANALGTQLSAGATIGMIVVVFQALLGFAVLNFLVTKAKAKDEHFVALPTDAIAEAALSDSDQNKYPSGVIALIPLVITLVCINIKSNGKVIIPVEVGVFIGAVIAYALMRNYHKDGIPVMNHVGTSITNAITAAAATSSMVAVGSVAKVASGWPLVIHALTSIPGPALASVGVGGFLIGGICASGSGGVALSAPIFGPIYAAKGVSIEALHRTLITACHVGGTLPNNGFINTNIIGIAKSTYKECYGPIFFCVPLTMACSTILSVILFTIFPNLP